MMKESSVRRRRTTGTSNAEHRILKFLKPTDNRQLTTHNRQPDTGQRVDFLMMNIE